MLKMLKKFYSAQSTRHYESLKLKARATEIVHN